LKKVTAQSTLENLQRIGKSTDFSLDCPARGQTSKGNIGVHSQGEQRCICHACQQTFTATKGTRFYRLRTEAKTVIRKMREAG
jgi:transposase-like protein